MKTKLIKSEILELQTTLVSFKFLDPRNLDLSAAPNLRQELRSGSRH